jgi:hypothetical protein
MKIKAFFIAMVLSGMLIQAQEVCKDIIYPVENKSIIFNCCIYEVSNGNMVHYILNGDSAKITAVAITKDGQHIDLLKYKDQLEDDDKTLINIPGKYKGHDFEYYQEQFKRADSQRNLGIVFTILGISSEIIGFMIAFDVNDQQKNEGFGWGLIIAGGILETIGIPLWISGGIRRGNNKKAMAEIQRNMDLSIGTTSNGIGITFRF